MLSVSNSFPVSNTSVLASSDNVGSEFNPETNSRVRITVPSNLGLLDPKNSYLKFNFILKDPNYKMELANGLGSWSIIRDLRVSIGDKVIEELSQCPVLAKVVKDYGNNLSQSQLKATQDLSSGSNALQQSSTLGVAPVNTQICMTMDVSGVLNSVVGLPLVKMGNLDIEFTLEEASRALSVVKRALKAPASWTGTGAMTTLTLDRNDLVSSPHYANWNSVHDCPFAVGTSIKLVDGTDPTKTGTKKITALAEAGTGEITITFGALDTSTWTNKGTVELALGTDDKAEVKGSYALTHIEYVCRVVQPPPSYFNKLGEKIGSDGGLNFDFSTFQCFTDVIQPGIPIQSVEIPTNVSRGRALICVPVSATQTAYQYDPRGEYNQLKQYQWQLLDGTRQPNRPVDCQNMASNERYPSQEHIRELVKGLKASSMGINNLNPYEANYVLARALSAYGATTDLSMSGARLYLEYLSNNPRTGTGITISSKNVYSYVNHIRRLNVNSTGISVST